MHAWPVHQESLRLLVTQYQCLARMPAQAVGVVCRWFGRGVQLHAPEAAGPQAASRTGWHIDGAAVPAQVARHGAQPRGAEAVRPHLAARGGRHPDHALLHPGLCVQLHALGHLHLARRRRPPDAARPLHCAGQLFQLCHVSATWPSLPSQLSSEDDFMGGVDTIVMGSHELQIHAMRLGLTDA